MVRPDGMIGHAEVKIGDSIMMLGEAGSECPPMPGTSYLYVNDADATYKRALQAGATSLMEPTDMFWGDRHACVKDRCGNHWGGSPRIRRMYPRRSCRSAQRPSGSNSPGAECNLYRRESRTRI